MKKIQHTGNGISRCYDYSLKDTCVKNMWEMCFICETYLPRFVVVMKLNGISEQSIMLQIHGSLRVNGTF